MRINWPYVIDIGGQEKTFQLGDFLQDLGLTIVLGAIVVFLLNFGWMMGQAGYRLQSGEPLIVTGEKCECSDCDGCETGRPSVPDADS